jgi:hypothetical protein
LLALKKRRFFRTLFCCFFSILEAPKPWKSSQNAVLYAKIGGWHFWEESCTFPKNGQNKTPQGDPKREKKVKTPPGDPSQTSAKKNRKKT